MLDVNGCRKSMSLEGRDVIAGPGWGTTGEYLCLSGRAAVDDRPVATRQRVELPIAECILAHRETHEMGWTGYRDMMEFESPEDARAF